MRFVTYKCNIPEEELILTGFAFKTVVAQNHVHKGLIFFTVIKATPTLLEKSFYETFFERFAFIEFLSRTKA